MQHAEDKFFEIHHGKTMPCGEFVSYQNLQDVDDHRYECVKCTKEICAREGLKEDNADFIEMNLGLDNINQVKRMPGGYVVSYGGEYEEITNVLCQRQSVMEKLQGFRIRRYFCGSFDDKVLNNVVVECSDEQSAWRGSFQCDAKLWHSLVDETKNWSEQKRESDASSFWQVYTGLQKKLPKDLLNKVACYFFGLHYDPLLFLAELKQFVIAHFVYSERGYWGNKEKSLNRRLVKGLTYVETTSTNNKRKRN